MKVFLVITVSFLLAVSGCCVAMPSDMDSGEYLGDFSVQRPLEQNTYNEKQSDISSDEQLPEHNVGHEGHPDSPSDKGLPIHNIAVDESVEQLPVHKNRLAAGAGHVLFVADDYSLWAWGNNTFGQVGNGTNEDQFTPVKIMDDVVFVHANANSSMVIQSDGTLWAWGDNNEGQLGDGTKQNHNEPVKITKNVVSASVADWFSVFLMSDGSLYGVVDPETRMTYDPATQAHSPTWPPFFLDSITLDEPLIPVKLIEDRVRYVSASSAHIMVIKDDDTLWGWGSNIEGEVGVGPFYYTDESWGYVPIYEPSFIMANAAYVSAVGSGTSVVTKEGELWSWGRDFLLTSSQMISSGVPVRVMDNVAVIPSAAQIGLTITNCGDLLGWGWFHYDPDGDSQIPAPTIDDPLKLMENVTEAVSGGGYYIAINTNGELLAWGYSSWGQSGIFGATRYVPVADPIRIGLSFYG